MDLTFDSYQRMDQRASPTLVTFAQLLQLASGEMQQLVEHEIEQNPALELVEREICPVCGQMLKRGICFDCLRRESTSAPDESRAVRQVDDDFDPLMSVAAPRTMSEMVIEALAPSIDADDLFIAEYMVGSLDERGFLPENIANEVVRSLHVSPPRAKHVLEVLQHSGPAGIGARNVRECLVLQLERVEARGPLPPLVRTLVEDHLEELGKGMHTQLSRMLGTNMEAILQARDFIRDNLRPYPVSEGGGAETWSSPSDTPYVTPDILIRPDPSRPEEFLVDVAESNRYVVRVSYVYRRLAETLRTGESGESATHMTDEERQHVMAQVAKAQQFIGHLRERQNTLRRVAEAVVERQKQFLCHGVRHLQPLTRAEIAKTVDLHESTVSRAVSDKYVLLPWREVAPFGSFFEQARPVEDVLREIIASESVPLTDDQLAVMLVERGYEVARRTVAKYRTRMGILPSHLRSRR